MMTSLSELIDFSDSERVSPIGEGNTELIVFSDLEKVSLIGEGNSRTPVYKVVHQPTGNFYALKQLSVSDSLSDLGHQEVEILKDLNHPNLLKCYDVFEKDGEVLLLLEYMDRKSLTGTPFTSELELADLTGQVLFSLDYLHKRGLFHGNIRPSKIFMNPEKKVKVAYLGEILSSYGSGSTTAYQSPERIEQLALDKETMYKADIWSLGLSILELHLGSFPYGHALESAQILFKVLNNNPPEAPITASADFRDFISCCLQKNPTRRCTTEQLLCHPFILLNKRERHFQMLSPPPPQAPAASSSPSFIRWTPIEKKLFDSALQLFHEDCPDRWEKVAAVVGGGKSAEDVKNHARKHKRYKEISEFYKTRRRLAPTTLLTIDTSNFREVVRQFTGYEAQKRKSSAEKSDVLRTKRTDNMKKEKETYKLALSADTEFEKLPEYVQRCLIYCSLFPLAYEFDKGTLVQLWIAEELIDAKAKDRMENEGGACFDILAYKDYIVPSRLDNLHGQMLYKVNESKVSSWYFRRGSSRDSYLRIEENKWDNNLKMALHISWNSEKFDQTDFEALKNCKRIRTIMLLGDYGSSIKQVPDQLFLCTKGLRTLDLSQTHISRLPTSVGCLESLHYLNLSYTPIRALPESIDYLYSLQTLKLRGCFALRALPKGMRKLIKLRHLDFDIVRQLNSMPNGMGSLTNLQTLKAFLVGKDDGCRISELKNMDNIAGPFCISRLENVIDAEEAKKGALVNKHYITKLELRWGAQRKDNSLAEVEILECLRPHFNLKELEILFYNGPLLPSWITNPSFTKLVSITLYKCKNCYFLPSLGELPSLRFLKIVEMNRLRNINHLFCRYSGTKGSKFFPTLEKLTFDSMLNLEEWTGVEDNDFPCLLELFIQYCPKFYELPVLSHFKALKYIEISYCPALPSLPEDGLPASLQTLIIRDCPKLKERCRKDQGEDWSKIASVPLIRRESRNKKGIKMQLSENEGIENKSFVVTGGLGLVGAELCLELVRRGARLVRAFDLRTQSPWSDDLRRNGVQVVQGDVACKKDVEKALHGADGVFHLSSYGRSGKEMLQVGRIDEVNINGTCHILDACVNHGIKRLVYVSTYNVVFGGKEIVNGNETLPYLPLRDHVDAYGRSKAIAEQLVLNSNGRPLKNESGKCLYTCAVRPAAVYGPGEEKHLPRLITVAKLGLMPFKIGGAKVKTDWVYVDNLVSALLLASKGLLDDIPGRGGQPVAAGQPYFVSDGSPVNTFEFMRPLLNGLDYKLPRMSLAVPIALLLGNFFRAVYSIMYPLLNQKWLPQPIILPAEVYKLGETHYFSILKAKEELGYTPKVSPQEGMAATVSYFQDKKDRGLDGPTIYAWLVGVLGMLLIGAAAYLPADFGPVSPLRAFFLFIFRSVTGLRMFFIVSTIAHFGEGVYAWQLAKRVDPTNAKGWFLQTSILGMFSLGLLMKRAKKKNI